MNSADNKESIPPVKKKKKKKGGGLGKKAVKYASFISTFHQMCELNTTAREKPDPIL